MEVQTGGHADLAAGTLTCRRVEDEQDADSLRGSFKLNQRSTFLNTETALIIDSPQLADRIAHTIERNLQLRNSWQVEMVDGALRWTTLRANAAEHSAHEPATNWWRRTRAGFFGLFPLEKYL